MHAGCLNNARALAPGQHAGQTTQMLKLFLAAPLALAACTQDQTASAFIDKDAIYQLAELDGRPFGARATISFPEAGVISGQAPCNSYSAQQDAPYPWFDIGVMRSTRRACENMRAEQHFLGALGSMTLIEANGDIVILRNDAKREMIFVRSEPAGK